MIEWLDEASPDIVCPQEIKTTDEKCPARALEDAGYGSLWYGQRSHHGVAILAKGEQPKEIRRGLPGDELDRQARYLERFNAHARALMDCGRPVVLAGDLNVVPTRADIYNDATRHLHPGSASTHSGSTTQRSGATPASAWIS